MPPLRFRKLLASLFVFAGLSMGAWAETYYWVGAETGRWSEPSNWNTQPDGTGDSPTDSLLSTDEVIISSSNAPLISDTDFTTNPVASITIQSGSSLYLNSSADFSSTTLNNSGTLYFCHNDNTSTFKLTVDNCNLGNLVIWGQTEIEINGNATASSISMELNSYSNITDIFTAKLSGTGSLTIGAGSPAVNLTRASSTDGVIGTFEIGVNVNCTGTIDTHSGVTLKVDSGKTLTAGGITHSAGNGTPASKIENEGTIDVGTGTIDLSGNGNAGCTQLVNSGTITAGTIQIGNADSKAYNNTGITKPVINNGTIEVSSSFTLPDFTNTGTFTPYSGSGTIKLNGNGAKFENKNTSHSVTVNELQCLDTSEISGNTTFNTVTAENLSDKSLTVNGEQTIQSGISVSGTVSHPLTLTGNGTIDTSSLTADYLKIGSNIKLTGTATSTEITHSEPNTTTTTDAEYAAVVKNGWLIKALEEFEYKWTGGAASPASNTDWDEGSNWEIGLVPVSDSKIIIESASTYPELGAGTYKGGSLTINPGASITLGSSNLVLSGTVNGAPATPTLSNGGTIIYTGNGRIRASSGAINDTTQGTVKYDSTGTGTITDFDTGTGDDYFDLVIEGIKKWSFNGDVIKIKNSMTFDTDAVCNVSANTTLQAPVASFDFAGSFSVADSKNITLTPYNNSDDFVIPAGMQSKFDFTGTTRGWLYLGSDSYAGTIKFNNGASGTVAGTFFPYKIRLKGTTEINADIRVTNSIYAEKGIGGTNTLIFGGTGNQVFTTTASYAYNKIQENKDGGTFKIEGTGTITDYSILKGSPDTSITGACTIANLAITEATKTTFSGNPRITTSFTAEAAAGDISFTNGVNITPDISLNTNGTVSFAGTSQLHGYTHSSTSGTTSIAGTFSASDITLGKATVNGTITGTTFQSGNLTVSGTTSITTSGDQNYTGTISGTGSFTLNSNNSGGTGTISFAGNISQLSALETTGAVTLNCGSVETTTSQKYNSAVTLGTSPASTHTLKAPQITFVDKITGAATLNLEGSTKTTLNDNVGDSTTPLTALKVTGPLDIKCTSITTSGNQTYTGGAVTVSSTTASTLSSTSGTISFTNSLTVNQDLTLSATGTNGAISFADTSSISGASNKLTVTTGTANTNSITFAGSVGASGSPLGELEIGNAYSVTFANPIYVGTLSDSSSSGIITFAKGGTISSAVSLATDGKVTINCQSPDSMTIGSPTLANFTRTSTSGTTEINGIFNAANISLDTAKITGTINSSGTFTMNDLIVTGTTTINSSGNQTYNGNIYGGGNLTLNSNYNSGSGTITFNKDVNGTSPNVPLATLTTTGQLTLATNCSNITTSGNQTYNSGVTISSTNSATITASNGTIKFDSSLSLTQDVNISSTGINGKIDFTANSSITGASNKLTVSTGTATTNSISFAGSVGASGSPLGELEIGNAYSTSFTNPVYIATLSDSNTGSSGIITFQNGGTITTPVDLKTSANVTLTGTPTEMTFSGSFTHLPGTTTTSGTVNAASTSIGTAALKGLISTSGAQAFNDEVTLTDDLELRSTLASGTGINFSSTASTLNGNHKLIIDIPTTTDAAFNGIIGSATSTPSIDIKKAKNTTFAKAVNCNTIQVIEGHDTQFTESATISTLNVTQSNSIIFNGTATITSLSDSATAGEFHFNVGGSITASSGQTFYTTSKVSFGNDSSDSFVIGSTSGTKTALVHTSGPTEIIGSLTAADITLNTTSITGIVTGADISLGTTTGGPMTIKNSGLLRLNDTLSFTTSFTQDGSGNSILSGSFGSGTGNGTASFATNVQLSSSTAADFGHSDDSITITKNLVITGGAGITIKGQTSISENLVMYKGAVTADANINVTKDLLVLGNVTGHLYSETDSTTGITNEYSYTANRVALGWSPANYTATAYPKLPDNSNLPASSEYSATLSVTAGITISVGKNFYANGTTLSGTGTWYLKVPDLTNPNAGFAEAYHSAISNCNVIYTDGSTDGSKARLVTLECTDGGGNNAANVDFGNFEIVQAYTVRDNVVYVEFNREIRYLASAYGTNGPLHYSDGSFTGIYLDPDCTSQITTDITTKHFYIKADSAWNTDATGKNGEPNSKSSDRNGVHHTTRPCLDFPRALSTMPFILTDIWGKRLNNYSARPSATATEPAYGGTGSTHDVEDKTGPVLWTVRTGQELHDAYDTTTGESSQHSYDSHNFLEFRYSEPVTFNSDSIPNNAENIQVTDSFGAIQENIATSSPQTLSFAGLAKISDSILYTGSQGSANKYMNALYRNDDYSIRLSIAGWTDGTVTDYAGNEYKKWPGYIENATQFTGKAITAISAINPMVQDKAVIPNSQIEYPVNPTEPVIKDNSTGLLETPSPDTYSPWDLSSPVFTPLRFSKETEWGEQEMSEAIGNTNGSGSTLDRIDFHFFDNTPKYDGTDEAEWYTEIGWCTKGLEASRENIYKKHPDPTKDFTYAADIIGGARQFDDDDTRRTTGGIRFSTKTGISTAFKYSTSANNSSPSTDFQTGIANLHTTVVSQLFTGSTAPMHPANDPDGLYLGLGLTDSNLSVDTTFAFSYNDSLGYLTDLAGNRLRNKTSKTIDRTPPSFDVIISPVDSNSIYIIFVKQIVSNSGSIKFRNNSGDNIPISESFEYLMPKCFRIITIKPDGSFEAYDKNQIDTSVPAEIIENFSNDSFTCIKLATTKEIDIESLKNCYVQLITPAEYPQTGSDPLTNNTGSRVTLIQDYLGNYMSMYSAHALSDFAVNYVNPLYAYSTDMIYEDESIMNGLYEAGSWAVHDWNADQQNYGTLPAGYPVSIVADTKANDKIRIYLSPSPDAESVSSQMNTDFGTNFRIWLPDLTDGSFRALAAANNTNFVYTDGSLTQENSANSIFNLSKETVSAWENKSQISFMFGLMEDENNPVRIYNNPYYDVSTDKFNLSLSIPVPLYSLRMQDTTDLNTLDLWSFKIKAITSQRGGVTILNNVINASNEEKTVVIVDMPEDGNLTVCVMTLDGNIITYLNRGNTKAGEYYYTWNGKNRNGKAVARGMYFVRVLGGGIDETRKVMVVK